ncbi:AbaSI family restriction endonuclease [Streptococcus sp. ZJ100]|uniref:AbaSI family restriction endonuclease n=1 Tax=Streptococcus handemini TaxID=3161188 RepID=UPI0032EE21A7
MNQLEKQALLFKKIAHKQFEYYVISRIIHRLNDPEIEWTTQQLVRRKDGRKYLIDLYFPQFKLAVEVDELHHLNQQEADKWRQLEIKHLTTADFRRIDCSKGFDGVNQQVEELISELQTLKSSPNFTPYTFGQEFKVEPAIDKGTISINDGFKFRLHTDVLKAFGRDLKAHFKATYKLADNVELWFPKLYQNKDWVNALNDTEDEILSYRTKGDSIQAPIASERKFVTFVHKTDALGDTYYSFKGIFHVAEQTDTQLIFKRLGTEVNLTDYQPK